MAPRTEKGDLMTTDAYEAAGVSFTSGEAAVDRIGASVKSTHDERVVSGLGGFGGVFDLASLADLDDPLLVASTDGVGTKTKLSAVMDLWEGAGADIVNHGINDVLVQGARPLFFLDTVAAQSLDPEIVGRIVDGMAAACRAANCVLLGGETAEMPGVFTPGAVDIAGTMVGAVERKRLLPRAGIAAGHALVGLASSGLHTNGYSLARQVLGTTDPHTPLPGGDGESIGEALCAVHRSYVDPLATALDHDLVDALAHITGGGVIDNLPRVLPPGIGADIDVSAWPRPPLFQWIIDGAELDEHTAHRVFNCGIGMIAVVAEANVERFRASVGEPSWIIGRTVDRNDNELVQLR